MRKANKDTTLPYGGGADGEEPIIIEKGQKVVFSSYSTHRWSAAYGSEAEKFRPERWETFKVNDPSYLPFHMGPRSCPGREYHFHQTDLG
jgi:cytochrome P450